MCCFAFFPSGWEGVLANEYGEGGVGGGGRMVGGVRGEKGRDMGVQTSGGDGIKQLVLLLLLFLLRCRTDTRMLDRLYHLRGRIFPLDIKAARHD